MAALSFSLAPEALYQLHDALMCLAKFHETVAIEAEFDLLRLSVLNSTKTAYAAFVLEADTFFESYSFDMPRGSRASRTGRPDRFCCQLYIKALLSVFKGRTRDKDTAVERCEVELHEHLDQTECRLAIKMICGLGVIKSYKLTYEPTTVNHAVFDRTKTTNQWSIEPRFLREITDHFSPSAEQLDIYSENGKAVFTSFTTKITDGKEILKKPVHTSVAIDKKDFEYFLAEDNLHIAITLKDFKAVIAHAESAHSTITARYTRPTRPLQLAYDFGGVKTEFTLMTTGDANSDIPDSSRAPELSARQTPAPVSVSRANVTSNTNHMPPPRARSIRPLTGTPGASVRGTETNTQSQRPPPASIQFDSLFVPADDDRQWDVPNDEEEEEAEDRLGWDATGDHQTFDESLAPRLRDNEPSMPHQDTSHDEDMGIPPTQRISQLHGLGLFD
ncbi:Rad9-domain-containing protein [Aspergillus caelatus]|uniref:DNA repair protein rad9 n=2 Tax=Aspergillus subgen. Circumdati TaxID=2720871 RepID=A0A5N7A6Z8_9EURO|nr:Rad9-domain-containing protein [Aspergillus caelatus]KAE8364889.1 Rad9-domain-containing protein [Aspergillus caelatus]KAE8418733.1 Rad9-domain-containing protein [Aspergillus pseudocaelatus]